MSSRLLSEQPSPSVGFLSRDQNNTIAGGVGIVVVSLVGLTLLSRWMIRICRPNEMLVVTGSRTNQGSQGLKGYRVVANGGWTFVKPVLETARRMDVTLLPVLVEVKNAYSNGGTPLNIQAIANVKVSTDPDVRNNAIERFLGRDPREIIQVAQENLEGNLRSVLAQLTPEEVNEDRLRFAEQIAKDVGDDLRRLGLQLDTLKIQSVSDDVDYLNSISRRRVAQIVRDAEIAEAEAIGQAERIEAEMEEKAEVVRTDAQTVVLEKDNGVRTKVALMEKKARSEEQRTEAAELEARAIAEQKLQKVRAELERLRLQAEQVLPAQANQKAKELRARGMAAATAEDVKASALVNDLLTQVWEEAGSTAELVFLLQQIEMVLDHATRLPGRLHLKRITTLDGNDASSLASLVALNHVVVRQFFDQVKEIFGIDLIDTLSNRGNQ
ncbi:SPFH domain-containing protein [Synechococcus sp. AH-551-N17]|uniref:flotillin family protein n=1 Tax=Synechococcus sp. MVIR-18-1 TaxID=1386941 RepID=UPI00164556D3|nr:SPFH domain-containing protein [Synechococcus sp. MVIR-18-1]MDB4336455.1 SPFH domain-containing protein [Synechococcus sp. AH-603-M21]MDC0260671.1 SPFH domain-containing protein [Synechococcus sp. AH-551-N17]QNI76530.1 flotillin-like protein [Synechococcus sp. MVIR-18-1]